MMGISGEMMTNAENSKAKKKEKESENENENEKGGTYAVKCHNDKSDDASKTHDTNDSEVPEERYFADTFFLYLFEVSTVWKLPHTDGKPAGEISSLAL